MSAIRTLIVDDMPPARAKLRRYLADEPRVTVVGEASSHRQAAKMIAMQCPQIAFLDIHLPDGNGLDLLAGLAENTRPAVVLVTAFDEHALRAFDLDARDYLLKPFRRERFRLALDRALARLPDTAANDRRAPVYLSRLTVKDRMGSHFIDLSDIDRIDADDHYLVFTSRGRRYLLRGSLRDLQPQLDPEHFVRVHRSCLVRIAGIRAIRGRGDGDYLIDMRDGSTVPISRSHHGDIRTRLGLATF